MQLQLDLLGLAPLAPLRHRQPPPAGPRPYEEAALDAWELAGRRAVIALAPGSGSQRVAAAALRTLRGAALCLVPDQQSLEQWVAMLGTATKERIGVCAGSRWAPARITAATFESASGHVASLTAACELLVVDEARHLDPRMTALASCLAPARLAFSLSPAPLLGPTVYALGGTMGRREVRITAPLSDAESRAEREEAGRFEPVVRAYFRLCPTATWSDFRRASARTRAGRATLAAWQRARRLRLFGEAKSALLGRLLVRHRHERVVVVTPDEDCASEVARRHGLARAGAEPLRAGVPVVAGGTTPESDIRIVVTGCERWRRRPPPLAALEYELGTTGVDEVARRDGRHRDTPTTS